jgi:hypothetical protein
LEQPDGERQAGPGWRPRETQEYRIVDWFGTVHHLFFAYLPM